MKYDICTYEMRKKFEMMVIEFHILYNAIIKFHAIIKFVCVF